MVREIPLTQGKLALVDDEDYELVSQYTNWYADKGGHTFYAKRNIYKLDGTQTTQKMHKLLTNYLQTDHINGNGLDNRRENLREATNSQNRRNQIKITKKTSSIYKGVRWHKGNEKWVAEIRINGKKKHIQYYNDEISAARAYDSYTRYLYGEFGTYNFPEEGERSAI